MLSRPVRHTMNDEALLSTYPLVVSFAHYCWLRDAPPFLYTIWIHFGLLQSSFSFFQTFQLNISLPRFDLQLCVTRNSFQPLKVE